MKTKKSDVSKNNGQPADEPDPRQEKVGYRRPPKKHAIKRGEVRNPYGRRGKPRQEIDFMDETIAVTINGRKQKITHRRFVCEALLKAVAKGNVSAAKVLLALQAESQDEASQIAATQPLSAEEEEIFERFLEQEAKRQATSKRTKS